MQFRLLIQHFRRCNRSNTTRPSWSVVAVRRRPVPKCVAVMVPSISSTSVATVALSPSTSGQSFSKSDLIPQSQKSNASAFQLRHDALLCGLPRRLPAARLSTSQSVPTMSDRPPSHSWRRTMSASATASAGRRRVRARLRHLPEHQHLLGTCYYSCSLLASLKSIDLGLLVLFHFYIDRSTVLLRFCCDLKCISLLCTSSVFTSYNKTLQVHGRMCFSTVFHRPRF